MDTHLVSVFVTAPGTGAGKTFVARALAAALRHRQLSVAAIKPIETGCEPTPLDATALARACGRPELATAEGLYRARPPLSPRGVTLATQHPAPDLSALASRVAALADAADALIVEGAGGLHVPLAPRTLIADFVRTLRLPLLVVAPNQLGVLGHLLALVESARARRLAIACIVLVDQPDADASATHNARILRESLDTPVLSFAHTHDDDDALARAAEQSGVVDLLLTSPSRRTR
jgi:dethiobiotin synthetase